jgi:starch synthase
LFGLVARLVHQKGIDLVISAAESIVSAGGQIVVLGKGERHLESSMQNIASRFSGSVGVKIGFDETTSRRIFAKSDFALMPSRFEPCGLSQMYAQRFGSLPIGHNTGRLAETIQDGKTVFLFRRASMDGEGLPCVFDFRIETSIEQDAAARNVALLSAANAVSRCRKQR